MDRKHANALAIVVGLAAVALPIVLAFRAAHQFGLDKVTEQAFMLSREVLRRSEATAEQGSAAINRLVAANDPDPCSDANLALMRQSDMVSSHILTVGAVSDGRLICSSLGRHEPGLPLGPVAYVSAYGTNVRPSVALSFAPGARVLVLEESGYAVVVHQNLAIDVFTDNPDVSLGVFAATSKSRILSRGHFDPKWTSALKESGEATTFDGDYAVAISRSKRYDFATFTAVPVRYVNANEREIAAALVPIAALVGGLSLIPLLIVTRRHTSLPSLLRNGLKREEFFLHYQPIMELASGRCVGAEALIRWQRQDGSLVRPELFIPVAEESGLIRKVTARGLELLRRDAPDILAACPDFQFSFNLSPEDLQSDDILKQLQDLLETKNISPENLHVEMTERGLINTDRAKGIVHAIRELGIRVAIDDFGTGFCSLSYLTTFEVDYLKIDKAFVDTLGTAAATSQVAMHIIDMAKKLNLEMIAEGVETEAQANILKDAAVQYAQGWLFAKAMPPEELYNFIAESQKNK